MALEEHPMNKHKRIVREYAAELRRDGRHENVEVYRYTIRRNNHPPEQGRAYQYWYGYAVRFSSTAAEDERIGGRGKFHDRSLVIFTDTEEGIPVDKLWPHGRILADFHTPWTGEYEFVPMWMGWRSPFEDSDMFDPDKQTAGFKRQRTRDAFPDGPRLYYYVQLDRVE